MPDSRERYQGKYRTASRRLKGWDYRTPGYYFITICTLNRIHWFGEVKEGQIILSPAGEIAVRELGNTAQVRQNASIDTWIVMPNHIHAIVAICGRSDESVETSRRDVSTETPYLKSESLGAIINQYKSKCTKQIRRLGFTNFAWQTRYYDHIIRNENELDNVRAYILGNPIKWVEDEYFQPLDATINSGSTLLTNSDSS